MKYAFSNICYTQTYIEFPSVILLKCRPGQVGDLEIGWILA